MLGLDLAACHAGCAVLGPPRCQKGWGVAVDGAAGQPWGSLCLKGPSDGKELLCLCCGAACESERMKDAGEGGWMKATGEPEEERSLM